jgi:hypothetical protein
VPLIADANAASDGALLLLPLPGLCAIMVYTLYYCVILVWRYAKVSLFQRSERVLALLFASAMTDG